MKMGIKNALCCFLLLVLAFCGCFHLLFIAFCCSSLLFLVFEIEAILSEKPKQANAFCCSFCFLWMFPFEHRIARCGFLLVAITKTSNKRQKKSKWKPGLSQKQERAMKSSKRHRTANGNTHQNKNEQQKATKSIFHSHFHSFAPILDP